MCSGLKAFSRYARTMQSPLSPSRLGAQTNPDLQCENLKDIAHIVAKDGTEIVVTDRDSRPALSRELVQSLENLDATSATRLADMLSADSFGAIFRELAPYLAMHRGTSVVVHLPSFLLFGDKEKFDNIMDEVSILHLLGVRIVLVIGVREQLDERLAAANIPAHFEHNIRVTDADTLMYLKEISGSARFTVESSLARGYRGKLGQGVNVVGGNFFFSAKPMGVRDGVDFKFTGEVRRVDRESIHSRLSQGDVCMLTSLGYSPSGEVFNVCSETLAATTAATLNADKIIYLVDKETGLTDKRTGKALQSLRVNQASALLRLWGVQDGRELHFPTATSRYLSRCVMALNGGVKRAHLVYTDAGAILKELYTRDGSGYLISRDVYEGIRPACPSDLRAIEELIRPLEEEGILRVRSRDALEQDIPMCRLLIRDGACLACGMVTQYSADTAEIACLAVHPAYRRGGRGETMLAYLEREAIKMGVKQIFVLSTRTMQWFEERGFIAVPPDTLPPNKQYDTERNSKVYLKMLHSERDVDAEEVLWNVL